jgi:exonuclease III
MNQINVLLINLGHGSAKSKQGQVESETTKRQNETLTFMEKTAAEHCPDLVLYQEGSSKKFLGTLREALENNVPDSRFRLPHPSERGSSDLIGVIINEEKLEQVTSCKSKSLDVHRLEALAALRKSDQNFLTEDKRAMVVMLKDKQSKETFLVVSFHGKNQGTKQEKAQKVSSEDHIEKLLRFVDEMKKRTACIHVLIGGDTNHVMETFVETHANLCDKLDISLLRYEVPDGFHRRGKRQIDYFLHSASLAPRGNVLPFNVAEEILDHHPLLASFQSVTVKDEDRKGDTSLQAVLKLAAKVTQKAQATLKDASVRLPQAAPVHTC